MNKLITKKIQKYIILSIVFVILLAVVSFFSLYLFNQNNSKKDNEVDIITIEKINNAKKLVNNGDISGAKKLLKESAELLHKNNIGVKEPIPAKYGYYQVMILIDNYKDKPKTETTETKPTIYIQAVPK